MQEMETLWKEGIDMFDGFTRQTFNLRAIIFTTIHDYQALFVVSVEETNTPKANGWSTQLLQQASP